MTSANERSQQRCGLKYDEYHEYVASANEHSQQRCGLKYDKYHEYVATPSTTRQLEV
ncbi:MULTISPECIES: hypothetical protein [Enterobacterales]|uniref:hypothetical protein n=1 Tax=Enterobacterales TaxID=91347 RepID=UPI0014932BE1|nr:MULTISPECIES: hypothetical protein [Enterobacterales]WOO49128.1 hypothetical protein R2S03_16900 [Hafnia alvei]WPF03594.1 hypothetical protein SB028_15735 [Proteus vulgaris]